MTPENRIKLKKLRDDFEMKSVKSKLISRISESFDISNFRFINLSESALIFSRIDKWPDNKWDDNLYIQAKVTEQSIIQSVINNLIEINKDSYLSLLFSNFRIGFIEITNDFFANHWSDLIAIDNDDITCVLPNQNSFICIELTEDILESNYTEGRQQIYDLTFSNKDLKEILTRKSCLRCTNKSGQ